LNTTKNKTQKQTKPTRKKKSTTTLIRVQPTIHTLTLTNKQSISLIYKIFFFELVKV